MQAYYLFSFFVFLFLEACGIVFLQLWACMSLLLQGNNNKMGVQEVFRQCCRQLPWPSPYTASLHEQCFAHGRVPAVLPRREAFAWASPQFARLCPGSCTKALQRERPRPPCVIPNSSLKVPAWCHYTLNMGFTHISIENAYKIFGPMALAQLVTSPTAKNAQKMATKVDNEWTRFHKSAWAGFISKWF